MTTRRSEHLLRFGCCWAVGKKKHKKAAQKAVPMTLRPRRQTCAQLDGEGEAGYVCWAYPMSLECEFDLWLWRQGDDSQLGHQMIWIPQL